MTGVPQPVRACWCCRYAPLILFAVLVACSGCMSERFLTPANFRQHRHPGGAYRDHRDRHDLRAAGRRHRPVGRRQHVCSVAVLGLYLIGGLSPLSPFRSSLPPRPRLRRRQRRSSSRACASPPSSPRCRRSSSAAASRSISPATKGLRSMSEILTLGRATWLGIPSAIWVFVVVFVVAFVVLRQTTFGRRSMPSAPIAEAAAKAGINVRRMIFASTASAASAPPSAASSRRARWRPHPRPSASRRSSR